MIDAMEVFREFAKDRKSIVIKGDSGVLSLLRSLREVKIGLYKSNKIDQNTYENAFAVFTRFQWGDSTYAAIVEVRSETDAIEVYLDAQKSLYAVGAKVLSLIRLPTPRIMPFPFFVICDEAMRQVGDEMARNYWSKLNNDDQSITTWLKDFLRYRREIVRRWAPDVEPAVPSLLSVQSVYALMIRLGS